MKYPPHISVKTTKDLYKAFQEHILEAHRSNCEGNPRNNCSSNAVGMAHVSPEGVVSSTCQFCLQTWVVGSFNLPVVKSPSKFSLLLKESNNV